MGEVWVVELELSNLTSIGHLEGRVREGSFLKEPGLEVSAPEGQQRLLVGTRAAWPQEHHLGSFT